MPVRAPASGGSCWGARAFARSPCSGVSAHVRSVGAAVLRAVPGEAGLDLRGRRRPAPPPTPGRAFLARGDARSQWLVPG